jgi:hypothetical protein
MNSRPEDNAEKDKKEQRKLKNREYAKVSRERKKEAKIEKDILIVNLKKDNKDLHEEIKKLKNENNELRLTIRTDLLARKQALSEKKNVLLARKEMVMTELAKLSLFGQSNEKASESEKIATELTLRK